MSDNFEIEEGGDEQSIFVIVGRAWTAEGDEQDDGIPLNVLVAAADDDSAIRRGLEALAEQGYAEAEFERIGVVPEEPEDDTFIAAYRDAVAGNVAVIAFKE